ncbi:TPA: hypothetical protein PMB55_003737, partial [Vibrio cholerae]|nr:hypothetical protein [Vibrio cholerae]
KHLPKWIAYKARKVRGDTLGLSPDDVEVEYEKYNFDEGEEDIGTLSGEVKEIKRKQEQLESTYKSRYVKIYNAWVYFIDFVFPIFLSVYSSAALYKFLACGFVHTFT